MAYEAIDIAQGFAEAFKDTPFGRFVQALFPGEVFDMKASVAMDAGSGAEGSESYEVADSRGDLMRMIDDVVNEQSVPEPTILVRTGFGFDKYLGDLLTDLGKMQTAAGSLAKVDAFGIANYYPASFSPEQAREYVDTVNHALAEIEQIRVEIEGMREIGIDGGDARVEYANDVHDRLAAAQRKLAQAASSLRGPVLSATA